MVRAKFRVLSITYDLHGASANLKPVIAKSSHWPEGSEENRKFWESTPTGEMTLQFKEHGDVDLMVGDYYYIDLEQTGEEDGWKLWQLSRNPGSLSIVMDLGWNNEREKLRSGHLEMGIDNEDAWTPFQDALETKWSVTLTKADGNHEGCPYTN